MEKQTPPKIFTRDFVLCFFAQFTFTFVFYNLMPTLPIYLSRLGSTEVEIGILIGSPAVASLFLRPFVGRALLRIPEKTFMIAGAVLFVLTPAAFLFTPPFWPFLIVRVFQGVGFAFFSTAAFTLIANISPAAHWGQSLGYFTLSFTISSAIAPPLGMFLINQFSFPILFLVCSGLSLCSLFIIHPLERRQIVPLQEHSVEDGLLLSRGAIPPSVIGFFPFFIWGALTAFFPLYAVNQGVTNPGFFFTTTAIVLILSRSFGGKIIDLYGGENVILPCLMAYIISMTLLSFSKTLPMFILVAVIYGIGPAFLTPALMAYALDRGGAPGPTMGTFYAITDLGICLGPVIMGIVIHSTSYPIMFLCLALMGIIDISYFYFFVRKKDDSGYDVIDLGIDVPGKRR
jgi:MFS family permease